MYASARPASTHALLVATNRTACRVSRDIFLTADARLAVQLASLEMIPLRNVRHVPRRTPTARYAQHRIAQYACWDSFSINLKVYRLQSVQAYAHQKCMRTQASVNGVYHHAAPAPTKSAALAA